MKATSYDFGAIIRDLLHHGVERKCINVAGGNLTDRMLDHYMRGSQPLHWRGEGILQLWCKSLKREANTAPVCEVLRGHRASRTLVVGPRVQSLPAWPVAVPVSVAQVRKKPGPKPKVRAEV